jgi:hypothetical protein
MKSGATPQLVSVVGILVAQVLSSQLVLVVLMTRLT